LDDAVLLYLGVAAEVDHPARVEALGEHFLLLLLQVEVGLVESHAYVVPGLEQLAGSEFIARLTSRYELYSDLFQLMFWRRESLRMSPWVELYSASVANSWLARLYIFWVSSDLQ